MKNPAQRKKILVGVDFSEHSQRALKRAISLARALDLDVALPHVVDTHSVVPVTKGSDAAVELGHFTTRARDEAAERLRKLAREADPEERLIRITDVQEGRPWQVITHVAAATSPELIVVGKRGYGPAEIGTGSCAERVVRNATCDVLVVRAE